MSFHISDTRFLSVSVLYTSELHATRALCLSVYFYTSVSVCLSLFVSVCLSLSVYVCLSFCLSVLFTSELKNTCTLCVCVSVCLSLFVSVCLSFCPCLCLCLSVHLPLSLPFCLCLSVCFYVCLSMSVCLSHIYVCWLKKKKSGSDRPLSYVIAQPSPNNDTAKQFRTTGLT